MKLLRAPATVRLAPRGPARSRRRVLNIQNFPRGRNFRILFWRCRCRQAGESGSVSSAICGSPRHFGEAIPPPGVSPRDLSRRKSAIHAEMTQPMVHSRNRLFEAKKNEKKQEIEVPVAPCRLLPRKGTASLDIRARDAAEMQRNAPPVVPICHAAFITRRYFRRIETSLAVIFLNVINSNHKGSGASASNFDQLNDVARSDTQAILCN